MSVQKGALLHPFCTPFCRLETLQAVDDLMEYRRRSPYFHAAELSTPFLVHSNTADLQASSLGSRPMVRLSF
jgi:hypothetical protein